MRSRTRYSAYVHLLLAAALVIRSLVPPGYMPGTSDSPLELCPKGLPATLAVLVQQASGGDHVHAHHHAQADPPSDGSASIDSSTYERCSIGDGLTLLALLQASPALSIAPASIPPRLATSSSRPDAFSPRPQARAPPTLQPS